MGGDGPRNVAGDRGQTAPSTVLLDIDRESNRRHLAMALEDRHAVTTTVERRVDDALGDCDLCIVDGPSFHRHREALSRAKETASPVYLPYLLVDGTRGGPRARGDDAWAVVDDVVEVPAPKGELRRRVAVLLRARAYSVDLKRRNDRLERFADVVSHDVRNPLNIARGFLSVARETGDPGDFDRVERAHDRIAAVVDDVLTLARTGSAVTDTARVELSRVARAAWEMVETGPATVDVDVDLAVVGDESRLRELFENAFRNCVEHGPREGEDAPLTVRVGALADGDRGFYVEDDGRGVPAADRERVFEYGYTTAADGTGFGLAIIEEIVATHGWSVRLTEGDGGGTRLEIEGISTPSGTATDGGARSRR